MKKQLLIVLAMTVSFAATGQFQYNASAFASPSGTFGLQLTKLNREWNSHVGVGITTFFNRGSVGKDYTNFYNPALAYEVRTEYVGSMYATMVHRWFGFRLGFAPKAHYYNGSTNGEKWYVRRDGGTYLLYGVSLNKLSLTESVSCAAAYDNVNGFSVGLGISFNER